MILTASRTCLWADSPGPRGGRAGEGWTGWQGEGDAEIKGLRGGEGFANRDFFCLPFGGGAREASLGRRGRGRGRGGEESGRTYSRAGTAVSPSPFSK